MEPGKKKQRAEVLEIAPSDIISTLPEPMIHQIFAFLSDKDVSRAALLSKTWHRYWFTNPHLVFCFMYPNDPMKQEQLLGDPLMVIQRQEFLRLMDKSICKRLEQTLSPERFHLYVEFPDVEMLSPNMDQWVGLAVRRNSRVLILAVNCEKDFVRSHYSVPQAALVSTRMTILRLFGCRFEESLDFKLPCLQQLCLARSCFGEKFSFDKLLSGCPVIEHVSVSCCQWMDAILSVSGVPHLKYFEFLYSDEVNSNTRIHTIKIDSPNLHTFSYTAFMSNWPATIDLPNSKALKVLKLSKRCFGVDFMVEPLLAQFPALEVLEFRSWADCNGSRISSQTLKKLAFIDCRYMCCVQVHAPNLESFEFCGPYHQPLMRISASDSLQIHLTFKIIGDAYDWMLSLQFFISQLRFVEDTKMIIIDCFGDMIIHENLAEVAFPILCKLKSPSVVCISSRSYSDLLDELFLGCPKSLVTMYSCRKLVEAVTDKMENLHQNPKQKPKLLGFSSYEVVDTSTSGDGTSLFNRDTAVFVKAHSKGSFKAAAFTLDWKHYVPWEGSSGRSA